MKNLTLLLILISLGTFIYYFEELGNIKETKLEDKKSSLIGKEDFGLLKGFSTPKVSIKVIGSRYFLAKNNLPVDSQKVQKVFKIISNIRGKRTLKIDLSDPVKRKEFFPNENDTIVFDFEKSKLTFLIGKQLDVDQSFYLQVSKGDETKYFVAHDISPIEGAYSQKDFHRNSKKYRRFKTIAYLNEDFYFDKKVFNRRRFKKDFGKIKSVQFENYRNKSFIVDFIKKETLPLAYNGIQYNESIFKKNKYWINNMLGDQLIFPYKNEELNKLLSTLTIKHEKEDIVLKVYGKYQKKKGYFVKNDKEDYLFELNSASAQPFFYNAQDFWNKTAMQGNQSDDLQLSFDNKSYNFKIPKGQQFKVEVVDKINQIPNHLSFKELLTFLNLKAERVSGLGEYKTTGFRSLFKVGLEDNFWDILYKNGELLLKNQKEKFLLHYTVGKEIPFGTKLKDFLK